METMQVEMAILNRLESDLIWFQNQLESLKKTHLNKFLAIKDETIITEGKSMEDVIKKLKVNKEDPSNVLIKFVSSIALIF